MLMTAHKHHVDRGEPLKEAARKHLQQSGEQWTDMREAVFDALSGFDRPASAYDIAEAVSNSQGRRPSGRSSKSAAPAAIAETPRTEQSLSKC